MGESGWAMGHCHKIRDCLFNTAAPGPVCIFPSQSIYIQNVQFMLANSHFYSVCVNKKHFGVELLDVQS